MKGHVSEYVKGESPQKSNDIPESCKEKQQGDSVETTLKKPAPVTFVPQTGTDFLKCFGTFSSTMISSLRN